MQKICRKCKHTLSDKNWQSGSKRNRDYICIACKHTNSKKIRQALKKEVIKIYGGKCKCCGETASVFLSIDHINNDGAEHRRQLGFEYKKGDRARGGESFYRWLKKNDFPTDNFQLLCFNCNMAKHIYGKCPHKNKK